MTSFPIAIPTTPGFKNVQVDLTFAAAFNQSPFSGQSQAYDWGGSWWNAMCALPPMNRAQAAEWKAFLVLLHGSFGTFTMGKVVDASPRGTATAARANGAAVARATSLVVDNMGASKTLLKGDYFSVSNHLHMMTADITSNGSGQATLQFEPGLRETVADNADLTLSNPKGTWRMTANNTGWTDDELRTTGITFACMEAF